MADVSDLKLFQEYKYANNGKEKHIVKGLS
jgi:hypothetical protein